MKSLAITLAIGLTAGVANAASLAIIDPTNVSAPRALNTSAPDFDLDDGPNSAPGWSAAGYAALVPVGAGRSGDTVDVFTGANKFAGNGLKLLKAGTATFTYLGSEAGFTNLAIELEGDTVIFRNNTVGLDPASNFADTASFFFDEGFLPFAYETLGGGGGRIANDGGVTGSLMLEIAYGAFFSDALTPLGGQSLTVFFGDSGASVDGDLDDLGVRIDFAPVPLPAGMWLMLSALGGVGLLARRRVAA